jgi:hypothetical protein
MFLSKVYHISRQRWDSGLSVKLPNQRATFLGPLNWEEIKEGEGGGGGKQLTTSCVAIGSARIQTGECINQYV